MLKTKILVLLMFAASHALSQRLVFFCGDSKSYAKPWMGKLTGWDTLGAPMAFTGWYVTHLRDTVDDWLPGVWKTPEAILMNIGTNDINVAWGGRRTRAEFLSSYAYVLDALHAKWPSARVYCMRVWSRNVNPTWNDSVNAWIELSIASRKEFVFHGPDERMWLRAGDNGTAGTADGSHYSIPYGNDLCAVQWLTYLNAKTTTLELPQKSISFGAVATREQKDSVLVLSNAGTQPLKISSIISNNASFVIRKSSVTIGPGQTYLDTLTFTPGAAGPANGLLFIFSNATTSPDSVRLDGVGTISGNTAVEPEIPHRFSLHDNFPNPFNPTTNIGYEVPRTSHVTLDVCDLAGRSLVTVVSKHQTAGTYLVVFDGSSLASGVYYYRLRAGEFLATKKLVLLK